MLYICLNINSDKSNLNEDSKDYITFDGNSLDTYPKLVQLNKEGFNIYQTLNTFSGNRRVNTQVELFQKILIDYDINDRVLLYERLTELENKYGIFPTEINQTFKGFHCIYNLTEELSYIDQSTYEKIAKFLNRVIGGDLNALQTAGIYKTPGFIDHKDGRNYKINSVEKIFNEDCYISQKVTEKILGEKIKISKVDTVKRKTIKDNQKKFATNINNLSFKDEIIPKLNEFGKRISILKDNKINFLGTETSDGIKYYPAKDCVVDFSHGKGTGENRANGNYNFLLNYVFNKKYGLFYYFCKNSLGLEKISENQMLIPKRIIKAFSVEESSDIEENNIYIDNDNFENNEVAKILLDKTKQDFQDLLNIVTDDNGKLLNGNKEADSSIIKNNAVQTILFGIYGYIQKKGLNKNNGEYAIGIKNFLEYLNVKNSTQSRTALFEFLLKISTVTINKYGIETIQGKKRKVTRFIRPLDLKGFIESDSSNEMVLLLDVMQPDELGSIKTNENTLRINTNTFDNKNFKMKAQFTIIDRLDISDKRTDKFKGIITFSVKELKEIMAISYSQESKNRKYILDFLEELKVKNIIKNYELLSCKKKIQIIKK